tara:strand:- start:68 stop:361 length:294 start_codon:yes stop_codon:yes gene_type:complete
MGKKRRMKRHPQKFGKKFASHPSLKSPTSNQEATEQILEAASPTEAPVLIKVTPPVVAEPTPKPAETPSAAEKPKLRRPRHRTVKKPATRKRTTKIK